MNIYEELGQRITHERKKLRLSREKLAELVNVSAYFVGQLERGKRKMSFDTLVKISDILHVSLDYLVKGESRVSDEDELDTLIERCSPQEKALIVDVLKVSLPHLGNMNR
ncbi:MAG: helix-turn-helix domain-containing protein [Clostridiales Family XIII bacterium]|nr:helix-turn-helix domain-containing protein [Clostridiales Family XIII bacterium]